MIDTIRCEHCVEMFKSVQFIGGDVAECGVGFGQTSFMLDKYVLQSNKKLFAFDTFNGLPYDDIPGSKEPCKKGEMAYCGKEFFDTIKTIGNTAIIPEIGEIEETLLKHIDRKFCFVWLDLDLYLSTLFAYDFFEDRMTEGGIIGFHDYDFFRCPGIKKVVDEEVNFDKYEFVKNEDTCYFIRRKN